MLNKMKYYADKMHRTYIKIEVMILEAITMYRMEKEGWQDILQEE